VGDERLLANQHAILKPQNLSDLHRDGGMKLLANNFPDAGQLDTGWMDIPGDEQIDVPDVGQLDAGRMDLPDAEWIDVPDAGQPDAGRMDVPDAEQIDVGQPDAERYDVPDAGRISTLHTEVYQADSFPEQILGLLRNGARQCKEISLANCKERNARLIYRDSKCTFRFFVERFYYVCNRNIIPVATSKFHGQKSNHHNLNCK